MTFLILTHQQINEPAFLISFVCNDGISGSFVLSDYANPAFAARIQTLDGVLHGVRQILDVESQDSPDFWQVIDGLATYIQLFYIGLKLFCLYPFSMF